VKVQVNGGSNIWWFAVDISGGNEETVKVEMADSNSVSNFYIMSPASYGYYFSQSVQLTLPISLRLTSASGKQIVLSNYVTSFTDSSVKDTQRVYEVPSSTPTSTPTSAPTNAPTTAPTNAPTNAPTTAPTTPPSNGGSKVSVKQHSGSNAWWFAVSVSGIEADSIRGVELKDSNGVSAFAPLESTTWGYYIFTTSGAPLVAPVSVRVTSTSGSQATATFSTLAGNAEAEASF